jgi:hypothetical protein
MLLAAMLGSFPLAAETYISAEPIPTPDIVGQANLSKILNIGYPSLALWSQRLIYDCHIVDDVIYALSSNRAINTVNPINTSYKVAAGGFQGVTDPSYVFTINDSGFPAASATDIFVLDNALGYALNQGGTAQFAVPFNANDPNAFPLVYAVVTFAGFLTGEHAAAFFDYLGTIDPALWTGTNAGFTQISLNGLPFADNSMLFLIGNVTTHEFTTGLFEAATTTPGATYSPLSKNGKPTVATAGAAFPGNDWIASPGGQGYLVNIPNLSPQLSTELAAIRQKHLQAVTNLLTAIDKGNVQHYLTNQFRCP